MEEKELLKLCKTVELYIQTNDYKAFIETGHPAERFDKLIDDYLKSHPVKKSTDENEVIK